MITRYEIICYLQNIEMALTFDDKESSQVNIDTACGMIETLMGDLSNEPAELWDSGEMMRQIKKLWGHGYDISVQMDEYPEISSLIITRFNSSIILHKNRTKDMHITTSTFNELEKIPKTLKILQWR